MNYIATIEIEVSGEATMQEIEEYINGELGCGALPYENPFIDEDKNAQLIVLNVDVC